MRNQRKRSRWHSVRSLSALLVGLGATAAAQDVTPRAPKAEVAAQKLVWMKQAAASYQISSESSPRRSLMLEQKPVLHWSNPQRSTDDGAVFLWTAGGRPEAIASIYRYRYENRILEDHEFQSLATTGLTARRDGQVVWSPSTAGITLRPIPGAPRPAETSAERLRQMRSLAREFRAFFDVPEDHTELRLLTKPLVRYDLGRADLLDGAIFSFVLTTDPEVLLLIEARPKDGVLAWHYALARMSIVNLRAQHKEQRVWQVDWANKGGPPDSPYITLVASDRPLREKVQP